MFDELNAEGVYEVRCISADGTTRWEVTSPNLVTIGGANLMLECAFVPGTATGPSYAGLITSTNFGSINQNDTLLAKSWLEASCYTGPRPTVSWHSANSAKKVWSKPLVFPVVSNDTVTGSFLVFGNQADNTVLGTNGTLWSASTFANGQQFVQVGDTIVVQYSTALLRLQSSILNLQLLAVENGFAIATCHSSPQMDFANEILGAATIITTLMAYHLQPFEFGTATDNKSAHLTITFETSDRVDAFHSQVPHFAYLASISEAGASASTQDGSEVVHDTSTSTHTQTGSASMVVTKFEFALPSAHELQIPKMGYTISHSETGAAGATSIARVGYLTFSRDNLVFWSDTQDATIGQYLLDDNGNFITDDAGNRIIID